MPPSSRVSLPASRSTGDNESNLTKINDDTFFFFFLIKSELHLPDVPRKARSGDRTEAAALGEQERLESKQSKPVDSPSLEIVKPGKQKALNNMNQLVLPCPQLFSDSVIFPPGSLPGSQEMVVPNDLGWRWHLSVGSTLQLQPSNGDQCRFPLEKAFRGKSKPSSYELGGKCLLVSIIP